MSPKRHEIPTHLNVEDKAFFGLSVRQVTYLTVGFSGAYGLWSSWPDLPLAARITLAGLCLLVAVVIALARPGGRGLEEWAFVALHHVAMPKLAVWRPREPDPALWLPSVSDWEELAPTLSWEVASK